MPFNFRDSQYEFIGSYNEDQSFTISFNGFSAALDWVIWQKIIPQERSSMVRLGAKLIDYTYNMKTTIEWQPVGNSWAWHSTARALSALRDHFDQPPLPHPAMAVIGGPGAKTMVLTMEAIPYDRLEFQCQDQRFFDTMFVGDYYPTEGYSANDAALVFHRALEDLANAPHMAELPRGGRKSFTVNEIRLEYAATENRPERVSFAEVAQVIIDLRSYFVEKKKGKFFAFFGAAIRENVPKFHVTLYEVHDVPDVKNYDDLGSGGNATGAVRPFMAPDANVTATAFETS